MYCAACGAGSSVAMSRTALRWLASSLRFRSAARSAALSSMLAVASRSIIGVADTSHARVFWSMAVCVSAGSPFRPGTRGRFTRTPPSTAEARVRVRASASRSSAAVCSVLRPAARMASNMVRSVPRVVSNARATVVRHAASAAVSSDAALALAANAFASNLVCAGRTLWSRSTVH